MEPLKGHDKKRLKHKKRKLWLWGMTAVAFLLILWGVAAENGARTLPSYPQIDITEYLNQKKLSADDYTILFRQTGLARSGVDALRSEGRERELLFLQEKLFAEVPVECTPNTIITREERIAGGQDDIYTSIPYVENGDILVTFNSHALGWRNGHAAIVVDAEKRLTLEARVLGSDSIVMSMEHWKTYPSFVVLRLKDATKEERAAIAEFAGNSIVDIPYHLTAGLGKKLFNNDGQTITGTQCAHLVWYAYQQFGYDLDSNGGLIVTPHDLYKSPLLEVVQVYGMPILP